MEKHYFRLFLIALFLIDFGINEAFCSTRLHRQRRLVNTTQIIPITTSTLMSTIDNIISDNEIEWQNDDNDDESGCRDRCDAEWKSEIEILFQISYDTDFYDFPLHYNLTSNVQNFLQYCNVTEINNNCYRDECNVQSADQLFSPANLLCFVERHNYLRAFTCFNQSGEFVSINCEKQCAKIISITVRKMMKHHRTMHCHHMSNSELLTYEYMIRRCHYQFCILECQKALIDQLCAIDIRQTAKNLLIDIVVLEIEETLRQFDDEERLFPKFCRRLLPDQYQIGDNDSFASTNTDSNNEQIIVRTLLKPRDTVIRQYRLRNNSISSSDTVDEIF